MHSQCNSTRLFPVHDDVCYMIRNVKLKCVIMLLYQVKMAEKQENIYNSVSSHALSLLSVSRKDFLPNFPTKKLREEH